MPPCMYTHMKGNRGERHLHRFSRVTPKWKFQCFYQSPKTHRHLRAQESHACRRNGGQCLRGGQRPQTALLHESGKMYAKLLPLHKHFWKAELFFKDTCMFKKVSVPAHQFLIPLTNSLAGLALLALWHWKSLARLLISPQNLAADQRALAKHAHFGCVYKPNPNILRFFLH